LIAINNETYIINMLYRLINICFIVIKLFYTKELPVFFPKTVLTKNTGLEELIWPNPRLNTNLASLAREIQPISYRISRPIVKIPVY
jgi:hypothetical protein